MGSDLTGSDKLYVKALEFALSSNNDRMKYQLACIDQANLYHKNNPTKVNMSSLHDLSADTIKILMRAVGLPTYNNKKINVQTYATYITLMHPHSVTAKLLNQPVEVTSIWEGEH